MIGATGEGPSALLASHELIDQLGSDAPAGEARVGARLLDITVILVMSPLLALVAVAIAAAVYLDSPGSVIFRVPRVGRHGRQFNMLKFRKMREDVSGGPLTAADDERYTPIGRFLANTRLDELPQIWNVLRGEMCLVGPRPEVAGFVSEFADQYAEIIRVTPGMTGPAQLRFLDEKSFLTCEDPIDAYRTEILPQKILVDIEYVRTRSIGGDLCILSQTALLPVVLVGRWLRGQGTTLRSWWPIGVVAGLVLLLFLLSSSDIA